MNIVSEVVKVFDFSPRSAGDGEDFRFRLEISKKLNANNYQGKVYRLETYRLKPTFPQINGQIPDFAHDSLIYVSDDMFDSDALSGASVEEVVHKFQLRWRSIFGNP